MTDEVKCLYVCIYNGNEYGSQWNIFDNERVNHLNWNCIPLEDLVFCV